MKEIHAAVERAIGHRPGLFCPILPSSAQRRFRADGERALPASTGRRTEMNLITEIGSTTAGGADSRKGQPLPRGLFFLA